MRQALFAFFVLVAALAFELVALPPHGAAAVSQTINASIDQNDDIAMTFADGTPIGTPALPGTLIPPGVYQIEVDDSSDISNFDLQGPGVDDATSVENLVQVTWTVTFQPCSSYSYTNDTGLSGPAEWLQTSASAASSAPCASATNGVTPTTGGTDTTTQKSTSVTNNTPKATTTTPKAKPGSPPPFRGTLLGAVSRAGKLTFTDHGKDVTMIKSGRYTITVTDRTAKAGFTIQRAGHASSSITGVTFTGKRTVKLDLSAGQWLVYPTLLGKKSYFVVIK